MNTPHLQSTPTGEPHAREGSLLFYVMGIVALLALFGMVSITGATLESRSARNKVWETQALLHAQAGVEMVKREVESGLASGKSLSQTLSGLRVTPPAGIEFDEINSFDTVVPERIFEFRSVGRSEDAEVTLVIQFRRRDVFQAGVFGVHSLKTQPNVFVFGYDSRTVSSPVPANDNGGATMGSNVDVDLGNNLFFNGAVLLGATEAGADASCTGCWGLEVLKVGHVDQDPLGINNNGSMAMMFAQVRVNNDNASSSAISGTTLATRPNQTTTLSAGDYYLTDIDVKPNNSIEIDDSAGNVRLFVDGSVRISPKSFVAGNTPFGLQIYVSSSDTVRLQPKADLSMFLYAPNAEVRLQPMGDFSGAIWASTVRIQPSGNIYVDTSLLERFLSNELEVHAWFEERTL